MVRVIEWLRMPGDVLFIVGGIFPIVYLALRMFKLRNRYEQLPPETATEEFTEATAPS
jgi:nitric oxide reductase subunit B